MLVCSSTFSLRRAKHKIVSEPELIWVSSETPETPAEIECGAE